MWQTRGATAFASWMTKRSSPDAKQAARNHRSNMKNKLLAITLLLLFVGQPARGQGNPTLSQDDRVRLAEAFRLGTELGNQVWRAWDKAPFAVLLVTAEHEFLIRHPRPSKDFKLIGHDQLLQSDVYFRPRQFSPSWLATFPAVGGVSTIVVGRAENTDAKTSTPWVVTLMHEHFHQLQDSQPNAYADLDALNLSNGDTSGMWMLNYPFAYESPEVQQQFVVMSRALADALRTGKQNFPAKLKVYLDARQQLQLMLKPDDYKYFSMQLWKEGIARYTEYRVARLSAQRFKPSKAFRALQDFTSFQDTADKLWNGILHELDTLKLQDYKRVAFYPIGAGEGLLLDKIKPRWHDRYLAEKFYVDKYFITRRKT
jgi:hypothetical protein